MLQLFKLYKRFTPLFVFLCVLVLLLSPKMQEKPLRLIGLPIGSAVFTLQLGTETLFDGIRNFWQHYVNLINTQKENEALKKALSELKGENNRLREEALLAARLKVLLAYKAHSRLDLIAAAVVGRKPSQWFDTITINKGEHDGLKVDMGVLVPQGVVGKIIHAGPHYAQVLLASDRNSAIGAIVQRTREEGIVQGNKAGNFRLKYLPHDAQAQVGDILVTTGMEGSFSKGLEIGRVKTVRLNEDQMFLKIEVSPAVNLSRLEEVLVLRSIEDEE